jgi:molybdate transport system substrate-binding protein
MRRASRAAAVAATAVLTLGACGSSPEAAPEPGNSATVSGEIIVFAAASLTDAFTELGSRFEDDHPGTTVTFNFGGSSALAAQIADGAPVDVFASAASKNMDQVVEAGAVSGEPAVFVRNRLRIAVPAGNPAGITGLADFAEEKRTIALCAEQVPCGAAARRALDAAGVTAAPDTLEQDVRAVLTKVRLGEVDAALVYRTDVLAAGDEVEGIDFPEADKAVNDYPIATLADAPNPTGAEVFVDFVRSGAGRSVLTEAGFEAP